MSYSQEKIDHIITSPALTKGQSRYLHGRNELRLLREQYLSGVAEQVGVMDDDEPEMSDQEIIDNMSTNEIRRHLKERDVPFNPDDDRDSLSKKLGDSLDEGAVGE